MRKHQVQKGFELSCEANGEYNGPEGCKPVECGAVEASPHSERDTKQADTSSAADIFSPERAAFKCLPGYSLDRRLSGPTEYIKRCQANGTITHHDGCFNINDCERHTCGPNGNCVDKSNPTGDHFNDYECDCDSGFQAEVKDGKRICVNIPDCPNGACLPGSCHDLVNDYKCTCPTGYSEEENYVEKLKHDCMPHKCGRPEEFRHASTKVEATVYFNSSPVEYTCEKGYSLDSAAGGDKTFSVTCQADKSFSAPPECWRCVGIGSPLQTERGTCSTQCSCSPHFCRKS